MSTSHHHHHGHHRHSAHPPAPRARAAAPTASLLRLSAGGRFLGVGVVLALLWAAIFSVIGWIRL